jgi:hypothetical protein
MTTTSTIPRTRAEAAATLPEFEQRTIDAYRAYEQARRDLERARGERAICKAVAAGEFEDSDTWAIGSAGAWRLDESARYVLTDFGREAIA